MRLPHGFADGLAAALLGGPWSADELALRAELAIAARPRWLDALCARVLARFPAPPSEVAKLAGALEQLFDDDESLRDAWRNSEPARIRRWFLPEPRMAEPAGPPARWPVRPLATLGALGAALELEPAQLAWFADVQRRNVARAAPRLRHHHYRWLEKRSGGYRLLETPKPRLKQLQRWVLREILAHVPPDPAAHGFVPARSVHSFVAAHVGQRVVLRLDLEEFFASIAAQRVHGLFLRLGYPTEVATALTGLCCAPVPEPVLRRCPERDLGERTRALQRLRAPHLPQGAPTSPALSNLIAFRLDRRLSGLAAAAGARYSRYADDLAFSGDSAFERGLSRFVLRATAIALEEGFAVRARKQRVMRAGRRQRLAGLVVNARVNAPRREYDALRATLHNSARLGPDSQNRDAHADFRAHLLGRIAWIAHGHPARGARLHALFARIAWSR